MRVRFLGTGPSRPIPRPGHTDALCRDARAGGRSRRTRASALVTTSEGRRILIDAGPDVREQLARARVRALDLVLLTHAHADAVAGLRWLDDLLPGETALLAHPSTCRRVRARWGPLRHLRPRSFLGPIRLGRTPIRPVLVPHSLQPGFPTHAFLFGKRFAYASDVARVPPAAARALAGVRTFALDAASWSPPGIASHLDVRSAIRIAGALGVRRLVLTHAGHTYPPHAEAERAARRMLVGEQAAWPRDLRLAYDGLAISV